MASIRNGARAVAINGSFKKRGTLAKLLKRVGLRTVHLVDGIDPALQAIKDADIVLFATPVLWFNVSSLMKELLEELPEGRRYPNEGKAAYLLAVGNEDGGQQAVNQMFAPLSHMGFRFPPYASQFVNTNMKGKSENRWQDEAPEFLKSEIEKLLRAAVAQ